MNAVDELPLLQHIPRSGDLEVSGHMGALSPFLATERVLDDLAGEHPAVLLGEEILGKGAVIQKNNNMESM